MKKLNILWSEYQRGDLSRDALFEKLLPVLNSLVRDDDLVQESAIRIFQNLDKFRGGSAFSTWVWSIVRNLRVSGIRKEAQVDIAPLEEASGQAELLETLTLPELDSGNQALWILLTQGFTQEEISIKLHVPLNTIKSRISRLKEKIRCS